MILENRLNYLAEDHLRTKTVCETMRRIVQTDVPDRTDLLEARSFLQHKLLLMLHDEDEEHFQILRDKMVETDCFEELTYCVAGLHKRIKQARVTVLESLKAVLLDRRMLDLNEKNAMATLEQLLREDMIVENAKLLPLARERLSTDDIASLRTHMLRRHIADLAGD